MKNRIEWLWVAGMTITTFLVAQLVALAFMSTGVGVTNRYILISIQVVSLFLMFGVSAFLLRKQLRLAIEKKIKGEQRGIQLVGITFLISGIMIFAQPIIGLLAHWNEQLHLPDFLSGVEQWMRQSEDLAKTLTDQIMVMKNGGDLILLIFALGIVPGVVEELYFRGMIQPLIYRQTGSQHLAVWLTAIFFSALHLQFLGFFPRLLLALFFGYMIIGNKAPLWLAMIAHAVNNTFVIVLAYLVQQNVLSKETMSQLEQGKPYELTIVCTILASIGIYIYFTRVLPQKAITPSSYKR